MAAFHMCASRSAGKAGAWRVALALAGALTAAAPALADTSSPGEPWVIDPVSGLAVPQSIERLAQMNFAMVLDPDEAFAAWRQTITEYQIARAGRPITPDEQAKAFMACRRTFATPPTDVQIRPCLARSGFFNFRP